MPEEEVTVNHVIGYWGPERYTVSMSSYPHLEQGWDHFEFYYRELLERCERMYGPLYFNPSRCQRLSPGCSHIVCLGCSYVNNPNVSQINMS